MGTASRNRHGQHHGPKCRDAATHTDTSPKALAKMANSKKRSVRQKAAAHPHTDTKVLGDLIARHHRSRSGNIAEAALHNPSCPTYIQAIYEA